MGKFLFELVDGSSRFDAYQTICLRRVRKQQLKDLSMDATHKAKLAQGRSDARAVKGYLEYLEDNRPKRGRRRTDESIKARLSAISTEMKLSRLLHG
jgi:hypothetical protein